MKACPLNVSHYFLKVVFLEIEIASEDRLQDFENNPESCLVKDLQVAPQRIFSLKLKGVAENMVLNAYVILFKFLQSGPLHTY